MPDVAGNVSREELVLVGAPSSSAVDSVRAGQIRHTRRTRFAETRLVVDVVMLLAADALLLSGDHTLPVWALAFFDIVTIVLLATWRGYRMRIRLDAFDDIKLVTTSTAIAAMSTLTLQTLLFRAPAGDSIIYLWSLAIVFLGLGRIATTAFTIRRRRRGLGRAAALVVGAGRVGQMTARRLLDHPEFGLEPIGFLDKEPIELVDESLPLPLLGASWDLESVVAAHQVDCVLLTFSSAPHDVFLNLVHRCGQLGVRVLTVPRLFERIPSRVTVEHAGGLPLLETHPTSSRSGSTRSSTRWIASFQGCCSSCWRRCCS